VDNARIILTVTAAQLALAMAPGPNTILVLQSAIHGRKIGFAAVAGIWPVGLFWAAIGLAGLGALIRAVPQLGTVLSLICGSYLVWLGIKAVSRSFASRDAAASPLARGLSSSEAFKSGVISNLTNPKSIAYYTGMFAATGASALPRSNQMLAAIMMPTISFLWYGSLAVFASHAAVRTFVEASRHWLDRIAGLVMIGFGSRVLSTLWKQWSKGT
jgi:threonine efflux protein